MLSRAFLAVQRILLHVSYRLARIGGRRRTITWLVGPQEIASMAHHISGLIPGSHTAVLWRDPYFDFRYDSGVPAVHNAALQELLRGIFGPITLGRLAARSRGILYLGELGYLPSATDSRAYEFEFLRRRGCALACYFVGSDIRSPRLMREMAERTKIDNLGVRLGLTNPMFDTTEYDDLKRRTAAVAEQYANVIFSSTVDQLSYLTRPTHPITYFFPDDDFFDDRSKFRDLHRPVVVHAPTNPVIKGTEHVRAAVAQLEREGYALEYVELQGVPNSSVRSELRRAHIALNQFYAYIPGVFGIEALASGCAVLMSADERIEPDLPKGSNRAWVVTRYDQVYANLKGLLDDPEEIERVAVRGQAWAVENVSFSHAGPRLRGILDETLARLE